MQDNEKIAALYILTEQELEIIINERVIEELKMLDGVDNIRYEVEKRIKELKIS